jgi:hypothetical protein
MLAENDWWSLSVSMHMACAAFGTIAARSPFLFGPGEKKIFAWLIAAHIIRRYSSHVGGL